MRYVTLGTKSELKMFHMRQPDGKTVSGSIGISPDFGTAVVLKIFDRANMSKSDQTALLGVSAERLEAYRAKQSVPGDPLVIERLNDFLRCYIILKVLYVREYSSIYAWFTSPNTTVPPTPLEHMKRCGIDAVRAYLESMLSR